MEDKNITGKITVKNVQIENSLNALPNFKDNFKELRENKHILIDLLQNKSLMEQTELPIETIEKSYQKIMDSIQNYHIIKAMSEEKSYISKN